MVEYLQLGLKSCPFRSGTPPFLLGLGYVESGADNDPYQLSFFFILRILFLSLEAEASTHRYVVVTAQTDRGFSFCGSNKLPSGLIGRTTSCLLVSSIGGNVPVENSVADDLGHGSISHGGPWRAGCSASRSNVLASQGGETQ